MKKLSIFLLLLFSIGKLFSQSVRAGEITYIHVSGFTYQFHLSIFSNDSSLKAILFAGGDGTYDTLQNIATPEVGPICYNEYSSSHTFPGLGTYVVSASINWLMSDVANIQFAGLQPMYLEDTLRILDPAFYGYNSSVIVLNAPIDTAATQNIFTHDFTTYDENGDSLSFSLVPYPANGYSLPPATDSLSVNSATGALVWSAPTAAGDYAIAILITEWRSGAKIGTELVDMMITVNGFAVGNTEFISDKNSIDVFPNPASSFININYSIEENATLTFTNTCGSIVKQMELNSYFRNRIVSVDDLPPGIYLVSLYEGNKITSKKMIITR
jgi:Secretion system C-terminal sorting domain